MERFEALFIKYLRFRRVCNYALLAAKWTERYEFKIPFTEIHTQCVNGTTKHGKALCNRAAEYLDEDWDIYEKYTD
jgi:hypothetical protein